MKKPLTAIDLFCGAGGSTLGAKLAGCKVIAAYDKSWVQRVSASSRL